MQASEKEPPASPPVSLLRWKNIRCIPCFHNRIQFARQVRLAFNEEPPDVVALELPDLYYSDLIQGIERLPRLSLLCLQQGDKQLTYLPVFPSDAMIEGLRLAREHQVPAAMIDLAVENYNLQQEVFAAPDDEAIEIVGLEAFYKVVAEHLSPAPGNAKKDDLRERHMAAHLQELSEKYERVLLVCGMGHWAAIRAHLTAGTGQLTAHHTHQVDSPFLAKVGPKAREALLDEIP
jgi:pheromone shutdown protein TraB